MDVLKDVDCLICIGKFSQEEISYLYEMNSCILFLDMPVNDDRISTIIPDFGEAVTEALDYLTGRLVSLPEKNISAKIISIRITEKKSLLITVMHTI